VAIRGDLERHIGADRLRALTREIEGGGVVSLAKELVGLEGERRAVR
jgi:hypothetical protein